MRHDDEFGAFVARAWPGLVRTAVLLTGDLARAEDLVQDALVRTHRRWRTASRYDAPEAYVRVVMVNLQRSWWRRRAGREVLVDAVPERAATSTGYGTTTDPDEVLAAALATLPTRMRATLVLRFYEDLSERQVADALGCAVGTVKSQTSRGLEQLRAALAAAHHERSPQPAPRTAPSPAAPRAVQPAPQPAARPADTMRSPR